MYYWVLESESHCMENSELNLFDFGYNEAGEYVDLVEAEKIKNDLSIKEYQEWLSKEENVLIKIADFFFGYDEHDETSIINDIKDNLIKIVSTKTYHYGNMKKGLYIFSLTNEKEDRSILVFENNQHYLAFGCNGFYIENTHVIDYTLDDYLLSKASISFPALYCPCFDLNGNKIEKYADGTKYQEDIRHIVCIKEWQMDKYSKNRIEEDKKIKDFYEVEFYLKDLIKYLGEAD